MKNIYFLVLGLSLLGTQQFYAQSIRGTFYNKENNQVIAEGRVSFYNDKGQKVIDMLVDQEGNFEINSKNIDKVQKIVGTAEGYNSAEVVVNNILDDLEVNFNLTKEIGYPRKSQEIGGQGTTLSAATAKNMLPFFIQYDFNSSYFNDDNRAAADELLRYMQKNTTQAVVIRSYVETRNNAQYNTWMGERRAQRVIDYLVEQGVSPSRLIKDVVHLSQNAKNREGSTGTAKDFRRCDFLIQ
ncbi:OmpA family protein [Myroides odoratus]|uniref:Outer membrane protein and related peptidoglycan-associated (Lipo)proteins n=1 Tax=Myroides odoratus TaxID=256 RepID=A0A378RPU2_MYROD|nr:OmpA family protein [Myroides odoratus]QQU04878.1 OmpA family protein [Myroides odoratus]STZ27660.1 Outer membrane protein and related peptidoglycan-associated (lipo)proteins [Myroides odoratus]